MKRFVQNRSGLQLSAAIVFVSLAWVSAAGCDRESAAEPRQVTRTSAALLKGAYWRPVSVMPPDTIKGSGMVFDSLRGKLFLVQHEQYAQPPVRTWEWDGERWIDRPGVGVDQPHSVGWVAYDSRRDRITLLVYSQCGSETWEWDGSTWARRDVVGPTLYYDFDSFSSMAFDSARGRIVWSGSTVPNTYETWEWDGLSWEKRSDTGRVGTMAFDPVRAKVVVLNGSTLSEWDGTSWTGMLVTNPPDEYSPRAYDAGRNKWVSFRSGVTSELEGENWIERTPATVPPVAFRARLAYDGARGRVVLLSADGHWEWDGTNWTTRIELPAARLRHAMVFDEARAEVVMLGGRGPEGFPPVFDDMWTWDGALWRKRSVAKPPARAEHAMAYDRERQRVVLFGGVGDDSGLGDTWEWDGARWQERAVPGPSPRAGHAMTYDSARGVVVLFGGLTGTGPSDETWEWDGTTWTQRTPESRPAARDSGSMAFDSARGVAVLFGHDVWDDPVDDTWEWNGTDWTHPPYSTAGRQRPGMAYDAARELVVMFGGNRRDGSTAEWDGTQWWAEWSGPPGRDGGALAYDSVRRVTVMFGGDNSFYYPQGLRDTWEIALEGTSCDSSADCSTGSCVDGVCCDTQESSCGECSRCNVRGSVGTCTLVDDLPCTDGNACTRVDRCRAGACVGQGVTTICETYDECSPVGGCDPATGQCTPQERLPDRTACHDGGLCRDGACINQCQTYVCRDTGCVYEDIRCPATECFVSEYCDPLDGCVGRNAENGAPCTEQNSGAPGKCTDGLCRQIKPCDDLEEGAPCPFGSPPVPGRCMAGDCYWIDSCENAEDGTTCTLGSPRAPGTCMNRVCQWIDPCASAEDGTPCTEVIDDPRAVCSNGYCEVPWVCSEEACQTYQECRVFRGCVDNECVLEDLDGTPCATGFCKYGTCNSNACVGISCSVNDCTVSATCDPSSGICSYTFKPDDTPCDDNDACTRVDRCQNGWCTGMDPVQCEQPVPFNPCRPLAVCDPATGMCPGAGSNTDAGSPPIDGGQVDSGAPADSGEQVVDGGAPLDAGSASDAGARADAGSPHWPHHRPHLWRCSTAVALGESSGEAPFFGAAFALVLAFRVRRRRRRQGDGRLFEVAAAGDSPACRAVSAAQPER